MPSLDVIVFSLVGAVVFAAINLYSYKLSRYVGSHKTKLLSLFGGVTATYVFLDLLPSLEQSSLFLKQLGSNIPLITLYEDAIFLVVLVGFLVFFVLEHVAITSRQTRQKKHGTELGQTQAPTRIFLIHLSTAAFPAFVFSLVFVFQFELGPIVALLYAVAVSMHLFISSEIMLEHYKTLQVRFGRFVMAAAPLLGWVTSMFFPERIAEAYVLLAFISGVILYHSIRSELPTTIKHSSLAFFLIGAAVYAVLLIGRALLSLV
jgi:hypothetical protein